jgi:aspartate/methionine/tyrosine aminotransferase
MALQKHFKAKRDHVLARLRQLHLPVEVPPNSTFYIWLNLEGLPAPLNNGLVSQRSQIAGAHLLILP